MEGADLVVAATNTSSPIVEGAWLAPGSHVVSIVSGDERVARRELDDEVFRRARTVVVHSKEQAMAQQHGDLAGFFGSHCQRIVVYRNNVSFKFYCLTGTNTECWRQRKAEHK